MPHCTKAYFFLHSSLFRPFIFHLSLASTFEAEAEAKVMWIFVHIECVIGAKGNCGTSEVLFSESCRDGFSTQSA
jgi:hypothetical protein